MIRRALVYVGRAAVLLVAWPIVAASCRHGGLGPAVAALALVALLAVALIPHGEE